MLRLTVQSRTECRIELKLEGWVAGAGVEIPQREGACHLGSGRKLVLDLQGLRSADMDGSALLQRWVAAGVEFTNSSRFVRDLLCLTNSQ